jgi:hypothetical protein
VVHRAIQLVHGRGAEGVAHLRPVEGDPYGAPVGSVAHVPVVGDVGEVEALHRTPRVRVEQWGDRGRRHGA